MLSISPPIGGAGRAEYYLQLAREDYYLAGGEPPGAWLGRGAERLGLVGTVDKDHLRPLLRGFAPDGICPLVQNAGTSKRQCGWDLTFSAPKSVSVLWAQSAPQIRRAIQLAQRNAVHTTMAELESKTGYTRRGPAGLKREAVEWVAASFEHGTSRNLDPQLHTHVILVNVGLRSDNTAGTLISTGFFDAKMSAGKAYQERLAANLKEELGLKVEWHQTGSGRTFEITGIPGYVTEAFSSRRKEILEYLSAKRRHSAAAAKIAALETRTPKKQVSRERLFEVWRDLGEKLSFGPDACRTLCRPEQPLPVKRRENASHSVTTCPTTVQWSKSIPPLKIEIRQKKLFPAAPSWSPAAHISLPAIQVKPHVKPWIDFLEKKRLQGLLFVGKSLNEAIEGIAKYLEGKRTRPVLISSKKDLLAQFGTVISPSEAKRCRPARAIVLLHGEDFRGSHFDFTRVADSPRFFTDEFALGKLLPSRAKDHELEGQGLLAKAATHLIDQQRESCAVPTNLSTSQLRNAVP